MQPFESPAIIGDFEVHVVVSEPPYYQNCYVVKHGPSGRQVVVDPGDAAARIVERLKTNGGVDTVDAILLTHGHPDHIAALSHVATETGATVIAQDNERPILENAGQWGQMLLGRPLEVPEVAWFQDEPEYDLAGAKVATVATPGHTPGGVCFVFPGFAMTATPCSRAASVARTSPAAISRRWYAPSPGSLSVCPARRCCSPATVAVDSTRGQALVEGHGRRVVMPWPTFCCVRSGQRIQMQRDRWSCGL